MVEDGRGPMVNGGSLLTWGSSTNHMANGIPDNDPTPDVR